MNALLNEHTDNKKYNNIIIKKTLPAHIKLKKHLRIHYFFKLRKIKRIENLFTVQQKLKDFVPHYYTLSAYNQQTMQFRYRDQNCQEKIA